MSDFFMPTQNNVDQEAEKYRNAVNSVQNQEIEEYKQKKQQHLENWDRYGVNVPDEYYDAFNKIIAQAPTPEEAQEEAYKIGSAVKYSEAMGIPLLEAYQNVDAFNEAQFTDLQGQKGRFEALSDMLNLGRNNVKLGRLGQELMQAHINNDTELANSLMAEIDAINQQNQLMQDNAPRSWVMQALEAGAQSLPFTGVVAGAGIVGNFIAPAAGTAASFAASSYLSAGTEYIDMIANGASPETARLVSTVSGGIQGLIEADLGISKSIVKSTARVIGKEAAENAAKKSVEEIGRKVFKRFHFGAGKKVLINYLENRGKDILGEGTEEFLQEITSIVGQEVAASLDGYDIPDDDFKSIVKQTTEAFRGGVLGALSMGFIPAGINAAADVREYKLIKDTAEVFESEEMFKNAAKDSPVFEGMSDEAKAETIHEVWQRAQNRKEEEANLEAQKIAEGRDAAEGAEEAPAENEDGTTEVNPVARDERGRLYTSDDVSTDDAGNVTGGTFVVGDKTKSENNRYGYIKYSQDAEGNITIDNFKMTEGRDKLRAEAFDEFARQHPDVNIEWNATAPDLQDFKNELIDANPSGKKNGLNYYSTTDLDNVAARKKVADELRKNIHNVKRNADGSYTNTELTNKQVAAGITLIESAARRMGMNLNEYINKTFGSQIFGSREEFASASLAQGEDVNKKAGGMYQGVAQANWREVGQQIKAVIYAGEHADFSTWAHEMAHVFQNQLDGQLKTDAEAAFNVQGGDWINSTYTFKDGRTLSSAEAFAYGFQDWLETGKAENEQMRNIFQKFAEFIADCYNRLKSHLDFTPEIESVFNQLLDGDDTIMSKALKAAQEQDNEYRASLKRQAEEKQAAKEAAAEQAKQQAEATREEASEGTEFTEAAPTAEELLNGIEEAENETKETTDKTNAIDNALENTNLTDEQKAEISEVLNDASTTVVEKAEATTEAAESAYDEDAPYDLFQNEGALLSQLLGEPAIQKIAEEHLRKQILDKLKVAVKMDGNNVDAEQIRYATGWEKDSEGEWKYETDDSLNNIINFEDIYRAAKTGESLKLKNVLDADKLYKLIPSLKDVNISFSTELSNQNIDINKDGITVFTKSLTGIDGEEGLKGAIAEGIQYYIQAYEYAKNNEDIKNKLLDIHNKRNYIITSMQKANAAEKLNVKYDAAALRNRINNILQDRGIIEARNVARRVMYDALERKNKRIAYTEDTQQLLSQEENPDFLEAVEKAQDLLFKNKISRIIFQDEINTIRKQYKNTDQWMKAPNGADSKLNEKQWLQVRTPTFKKWFGDWEVDPVNASRVVDENGEPLVVYHGSNQWFTTFNEGKTNKTNVYTPDNTIFTNDSKEIASSFQNYYGGRIHDVILDKDSPLHRRYDWGVYREGGVYSLFMNLRNPKIVDYKGQQWNAEGLNINEEVAKAMQEGYDGFIAKNIIDVGFTDTTPPASNDYIAFNNNAVKSATDNNGNFDVSNPNILFQEERDNEYEEAVKAGDIEKAKQMLQEEAERKGYNLSSDYQGTSAFNGAAPYRNGYYSTKEERLEAVKNEEFEDTATLGDYAYDNADPLGFEFLIQDPRAYRSADDKRKEAIDNLRKAVSEARSGKKNVTIKMYRSVPADIKEGSFRNGDWITPSKSYAEDNADVHGWGAGEYRIIEQDVDLEHIWWDGNDIAEWGYDDEKDAVYKNTGNNRKLFEVTYDEEGNLIPLSQRFDESNPSILYQIAGEIGAEVLDTWDEIEGVKEGVSRMQNLAIAKQMEAEGKDAKAIRLATGWEKGSDGYWKWEIDDSKVKFDSFGMIDFNKSHPRLDELTNKLIEGKALTVEEQKEFDELNTEYGKVYDEQNNSEIVNYFGKKLELSKILDNEELFKAYPQLKNIIVEFKPQSKDGTAGSYNEMDNVIKLYVNSKDEWLKQDNLKSTLLHEVQHAIQRIENFPRGGNVNQFKPRIRTEDEIIKKDLQWTESLEESYPDKKDVMQEIKALMLNGNRNQAWEKIHALQKEAIEKDDRDYARYIDEYGYKLDKIQRNIITKDIESPEQQYRRLAGETESRNVQTRINFTPEERLNTLLAATEDVAPEDKIILFQTVYHGSGADFDKFDTENFALSGEGSMTFGYGTYVTDSEDIARDYAERQRPRGPEAWTYKGQPVSDFHTKQIIGFLARNNFNKEEAIKELEDLKDSYTKTIQEGNQWITPEMVETVEKEIKILKDPDFNTEDLKQDNDKAKLYTVEIPDDGYLDWEQPVTQEILKNIAPVYAEVMYKRWLNDSEWQDGFTYTEQQKQGIRNSFEEALYRELEVDPTYNGAQLYNYIRRKLEYYDKENGARLTSKLLYNAGYAGIKYPAGTIHGNGNGAYNYVIFNDDDAQIVDKLLFQTNAELMDEARTFDNWQEFMEYCEAFHADDEVSPIPSDAAAQWYQTFYETSNGVKTEQEKNEEALKATAKKDTQLPVAVDALFTTMIRSDPQMVDSFLQAVAELDAIDLDSEEWQQAESAEDAAQRDQIEKLKDFIGITLNNPNWDTAIRRVQGGHEITEGHRKRLISDMTDSFKARDFRALYSEVMNDEQYAVAPEDSITAVLNKKLKKYHDIVKPNDDISRWSPERRKQLAEQIQNREIAELIRSGSLKLDDRLDAYIKSLNKQIKETQDQYNELEKETKADYQRIADKERRDLLKLHEQLLLARGKLKTRNQEIERKIKKGLKITEKYRAYTQNMNANYDEIFRKYSDLRNTITISAEVQAALDRQEQVAGLREDLNAKQKEKNLTSEVKKMRIQLVKRTMRRVPFNRVDYNNARTVIAIQRMLEPNLLGGVNRFIGIDSPYLRGVISQIVTDSDYKESIMAYLSKNTKASQAFADFKKKLTELKSIKDFDSWTAKDRKAAIRYLPKENWVRDLKLKELAKEREESIDLDIGMEEVKRTVYDEKTGEPKTYKDAEGNEHNVTETAFRLKYDDEIGRLVQDAVGADMFDKIVNMPFSEWTTEDLEALAQRIDELYTEGRDLKAAKDEARKKEAAAIRKHIEDAIKETGITINDDDTPEEKERKQKQIEKILGMSDDLKGTEAAKPKGFKAKITRLLHSYSDMNVLRFARMLDGQSEGENVRMLYRNEDDCYNRKQRSMNSRADKIYKVMQDNGITEGDLAETVEFNTIGSKTEFTVDELLYFLAADKDYAEDEKKLQKGLIGLDANDDYAATSRNAVMFGNMMSDMMSQDEKESWLQLDKDMEEALQNDTLTQEQKEQLATGQLDKKPGTTRYIAACHAKWGAILGLANSFLNQNPKFKALMEAIEADYAEQYGRMNEVSINEFNMPVHRVKAYVPLVRRESNGDTNENQVKEDLLGAAGVGKQWADRGMTQRRVNIGPLNQKPVQTGLFRTWADSIERTEHFIAYAPYVRQLNAIYKSRDASYTRRFIESRYGAGAIKYLDEYINEVANPNAGRIRERGAEWLHVLRGKTAPAYLGWKASAIIKQGLTSPWPYMQFINPAEYVAAAMKFTFNPEMREAIKEKSVFMKMRRMDPVNDLIDEMADNAKTKLDRGWSNFSKIGMQGLELIDWACVAPGWLACYEKKYNQLQNASNARYEAKMAELKERNMYAEIGTSEYLTPQQMEAEARKELAEDIEAEAVRYADDCTRACQPSNRVTDLAPLFKNSSEAMKAFLQFQTSLNVIWQNLRYDMPYAVKNKEFTRIAGTVIGYVCAGIFMNSVMEGIGGDDDDDETQALRNLIYYSTTQFTDSIPIMGSEITNAMDQLITGKRGFYGSGTDMTPSATKLLSVLTNAKKGNWQKAAELTAEGIGLYLGAPVSGAKEINKLLGKPLDNGDVNLARGISDVYGIAGDILEE